VLAADTTAWRTERRSLVASLDSAFFDDDGVRAALAARDIGKVYRLLVRVGVSQRRIAQWTGQSQSEICEILRGRQVRDVRVLERIADGLGIPRAWLGVSYGEEVPDPSSVHEEVDEEVKRRALLVAASTAVVGQALVGGGEPVELALPSGQSLPSRLGMSDVRALRAVTEQLRGVARYYGGQAGVFGAAATAYTPWLQVPAPEAVKTGLVAALAELHTRAGWCCHDSGVDGAGYLTRALSLADEAGDTYGVAYAAWTAGATLVRSGHPNDALKLFQLGQCRLKGSAPGKPTPVTDDPRVPTVAAWLGVNSATAYAVMGGVDEATRCLAEAHEGWEPRFTFERGAMDSATARIQLDLGRLDAAEQFAASAVRTYGENHRLDRTSAELLLAEVHVRAGEPRGLTLAREAIGRVKALQSVTVRRERLVPLAAALDARPGSDTRELARMARQVATTQA
jgi:transcriptional regulator with XRE-family HTH domain/tetratricopeptide (TPR) repeat protein